MKRNPISANSRAVRLAPLLAAGLALLLTVDRAGAADDGKASSVNDPSILRVCAAADELPLSHRDGSGFENRIATAVADAMGRKAQFVWLDKPSIYIVRDQLEPKLCDVVIGVDTGDPRLLTTKSYYRAPYVFVQRKDSKLKIVSWDSTDLRKAGKIGFTPGSPPQTMMEKIGLFEDNFNYLHSLTNFKDKRNKYTRIPPDRMVSEVADGTADLAVNFAPEVARYVKANLNLKMIVIPDNNVRSDGEKVPHHFDQSMGVRKDDAALQQALDAAIEKSRGKIDDILKEEGIPLLSQSPRS